MMVGKPHMKLDHLSQVGINISIFESSDSMWKLEKIIAAMQKSVWKECHPTFPIETTLILSNLNLFWSLLRKTLRGPNLCYLPLMAEILHQLRLVVFPIIYRVSAPPQVVIAGFQPSTAVLGWMIHTWLPHLHKPQYSAYKLAAS